MKTAAEHRRRPYRMKARAEAVAVTAAAIMDAAVDLFSRLPYDEVGLEDVAEHAGVSVRTVLRRFGSKEGLFAEACSRTEQDILAQRRAVPVGDVRGAVRNLFDHYEAWGDQRLLFIAQEHRIAQIGRGVEAGRRVHQEWVETAFGPFLSEKAAGRRRRLVMALVAATDVYTWKLLRRDWGLSRPEAERTIEQMIKPMLGVE